ALRPLHPGEDLHLLGLHIESAPVRHHPSSIGWRITLPNRATLAWPGDTGPCDALPHLVRNASLAVLECGFPDGTPLEGHLTPSAILDAIAENPPDQLAIVHRYPLALHDDTLLPRLRERAPCPVLAPDDGHLFPLLP
ncbi:MAG: hypothetical protein EA398_10365, partial [Deltaproteobacteria bacterium]